MASAQLARIRRRWENERKISARDVAWLLDQAGRAETMAAADELRRGTQTGTGDFMKDLFGL